MKHKTKTAGKNGLTVTIPSSAAVIAKNHVIPWTTISEHFPMTARVVSLQLFIIYLFVVWLIEAKSESGLTCFLKSSKGKENGWSPKNKNLKLSNVVENDERKTASTANRNQQKNADRDLLPI